MKASRRMQAVIEQITQKHGLDLTKMGASVRLEMPHFDPLMIENIGSHCISVCHYYLHPSGDLNQDPEIEFLVSTDSVLGGWYPYAITQVLSGYRRVAEFDEQGNITGVALRAQADVAAFADVWADAIHAQGWQERGAAWQGQVVTQAFGSPACCYP